MTGFIDSSLTLDVVEGNDRAAKFRSLSANLSIEWCVSPLVRMECRVRALSEGREEVLARTEEVLASVRSLSITDEVFERAALVRAQTGLKTPDAIHVATALVYGCAMLWTPDARMARAKVEGLGIRLVA